jgi:hypothetical protein
MRFAAFTQLIEVFDGCADTLTKSIVPVWLECRRRTEDGRNSPRLTQVFYGLLFFLF